MSNTCPKLLVNLKFWEIRSPQISIWCSSFSGSCCFSFIEIDVSARPPTQNVHQFSIRCRASDFLHRKTVFPFFPKHIIHSACVCIPRERAYDFHKHYIETVCLLTIISCKFIWSKSIICNEFPGPYTCVCIVYAATYSI